MALTKDEMKVLLNIISACETGNQQYGEGDYADFTPAYANSYEEHGITIGRYQHYATEARDLLRRIKEADPELFAKLDTEEIASDLVVRNWSYYKILKGSAKAKCIQRIISSDVGIRVQDEMASEQMAQYVKEAEKLGVTDHQAQCISANFRHQGGLGALKRIIAKTKQPYTLDNLYNASKSDTGNQVGAYKSRQKFVYESLKKYWPSAQKETEQELKRGSEGTAVKELQTKLIKMGYDCGSAGADGDFGKRTESALKTFQKVNDLEVTGVYDKESQLKVKNNIENQIFYKKSFVSSYKVSGAKALYFRKDAGKQNDIVGIIGEGESVTCNGNYKKVDGVVWYSIIYKSQKGYSSSKYLLKA